MPESLPSLEKDVVCEWVPRRQWVWHWLEELETAHWRPSPKPDANEQCEFQYQPEGWGKAYRFIALRYPKKDQTAKPQYQLFATPKYIYRVFVTHMKAAIDLLVRVRKYEAEMALHTTSNSFPSFAHAIALRQRAVHEVRIDAGVRPLR